MIYVHIFGTIESIMGMFHIRGGMVIICKNQLFGCQAATVLHTVYLLVVMYQLPSGKLT